MEEVDRLLRSFGVELVTSHEQADLVVVNTCTVTSIADRKSRQIVRRARRINPEAQLLVTGCSVVVDPAGLRAADPAARLFDNDSKGRLLRELSTLLRATGAGPLPTLSGAEPVPARPRAAVETDFDRSPRGGMDGHPGPDRTRSFVKIQDGCSFRCTYCIIPRARGAERSVPADDVLAQVRRAVAAGRREIVLTGINAGTYAAAGRGLPGLVRRILSETSVERIRLSSIEPQHLTGELLGLWSDSGGRCLPHFHIPLQSGDDTILRRMGRRYDAASYEAVVERVREAMPGAAVHADVIVGFPGEDDAAWARTVALLRQIDVAGIHVFRYSPRPGTPAARMVGQVDGPTKKQRAAEALELATQARARFAERQLGLDLRVLFEKPLSGGRWLGLAESHVTVVAAAPHVDSLENAIGLIRAESIHPGTPDRIEGRLLALSRTSDAQLAPIVGRSVRPGRGPGGIRGTKPEREPLAEVARK